jgi:hypothetical protein
MADLLFTSKTTPDLTTPEARVLSLAMHAALSMLTIVEGRRQGLSFDEALKTAMAIQTRAVAELYPEGAQAFDEIHALAERLAQQPIKSLRRRKAVIQ